MTNETETTAMQPPPHLLAKHVHHLKESGLTNETVYLSGMYSAGASVKAPRGIAAVTAIVGWRWRREHGDVIVIPFLEPDARGLGYADSDAPLLRRVRTFGLQFKGKAGPKYLQAKDSGFAPYFPPRATAMGLWRETAKPLMWTEGEKKALLLDQLGYPAIGSIGVSCFHDKAHRDENAEFRIHPLIKRHVDVVGRDHVIVFDSDAAQNDEVMNAAGILAGMLTAEGAKSITFVRIPGEDGDHYGIDDYFVTHGEEATRALLATGTPIDPLPTKIVAKPIGGTRLFRGAPISPGILTPAGYALDPRRGVIKLPSEGQKNDVIVSPRPIAISRILEAVDTGEERLEVLFKRAKGWRRANLPREVAYNSRSVTTALAKLGAPVTSSTAKHLVDWLAACEERNESRIPRVRAANRCGWHTVNGKRHFLAPDSVTHEQEQGAAPIAFDLAEGRQRMVSGLRAEGDEEKSRAAIKRAIAESDIAAAAIFAALAAPLLEVLAAPSFAVHLVGDSSTGKSSMQKIAASIYGDPSSREWIPGWDATGVGLEVRAATMCDLPLFIDESGTLDPWKREQAVYQLINGVGRTRGAKEGGLRETKSWRTILVSTGEQRLVDNTTANTGAQVRVLHLRVEGFGELGAHGVDSVVRDAVANFGWLGRTWLQSWARVGDEEIVAHRESYRNIVDMFREDGAATEGLRSRQSAFFALLSYAESVATEVLGIGDQGCIMERLFLSPDGAEIVRSAAARAIDVVADWVVSKRAHFGHLETTQNGVIVKNGDGRSDWFGFVDDEAVYFLQQPLMRHLREHGLDSSVLSQWKSRGWLSTNRDGIKRNTIKKRIAGVGRPRLVSVPKHLLGLSDEGVAPAGPGDSDEVGPW